MCGIKKRRFGLKDRFVYTLPKRWAENWCREFRSTTTHMK